MTNLTPDLFWLAATAVLTMLMWVPHISWLILQEGLFPALMDRNHAMQVKPMWAKRAQKAHTNATDNLAAFGILVLVAHLVGIDPAATGQLAMYYFVLRALHYGVYTLGLPVIRTLIFLATIGVNLMIAWQFLG
jgi:uncharacterized MAPEG superfamily protein